MATSKNPTLRDHFVYVIHANKYPICVGHGHAGRLSMRPNYIDGLIRNHPDRTYEKWKPHGIVVAELWKRGIEVFFDQLTYNQTKAEAAALERRYVGELTAAGFRLTKDSGPPATGEPEEVLAEVMRQEMTWAFLTSIQPVNRYQRSPKY